MEVGNKATADQSAKQGITLKAPARSKYHAIPFHLFLLGDPGRS
jgi:hypothetical protein